MKVMYQKTNNVKIGKFNDHRCRSGPGGLTRKECRNNCKHWINKDKKCKLGY